MARKTLRKSGNFEKEIMKDNIQKSKDEGNFLPSVFKWHIGSETVFLESKCSACNAEFYYLH